MHLSFKDNAMNISKTLKRTTIITTSIWLLVALLFVLQILLNSQFVFGIAFLLFIFGAIPCSLCFIIDWLKFIGKSAQSKWLNYLIYYAITSIFIYGIGYWIDFLIDKKIAYLPLKLVLLVSFAFFIYGVFSFIIIKITYTIFKTLFNQGIALPKWAYYVVSYLIILGVYQFNLGLKNTAIMQNFLAKLDYLVLQFLNFG